MSDPTSTGPKLATPPAAPDAPDEVAELPAPPVGTAEPLTAAYCAERAARLIHQAEVVGGNTFLTSSGLLSCAQAWRELAVAMASHLPVMHRPRDPDQNPRR